MYTGRPEVSRKSKMTGQLESTRRIRLEGLGFRV